LTHKKAKGYPDLQTRQFLYLLSTKSPHIPIYCLVDFDADGIGIMSTYKYGSIALHHQREILAVPSVRWLGVRSLLELTSRDRRIARRMLEKETMEEEGREVEWRRELQVMLMLNLKAEIQILSDGDGGLEKWLDEKLRSAAT
jgi:meiotic recombination protein SPO11